MLRNLKGITVFAILALGILAGSTASSQEPLDSYMIVLDVSSSMRGEKLEEAKAALTEALEKVDDQTVNLGLRAFSGCGTDSSTLISAPKPNNAGNLIGGIEQLRASGSTAIEGALRQAVADFPEDGREHTILLVSDGEEECKGDPCLAMKQIVADGTQVVVNTIGFQTQGTPAEPQLQCIADVTGGTASSVSEAADIGDIVSGNIQTCTIDELVKCFAPIVLFSETAEYFPMDPSDFISGSELIFRHTCETDEILFNTGAVNEFNLTNQRVNDNAACLAIIEQSFLQYLESLPDPPSSIYQGSYTSKDYSAPFGERIAPNGAPRAESGENGRHLPITSGYYLHHTDAKSLTNKPLSNVVAAPAFYFLTEHNQLTEIHYWFFYGYDPKRRNNFTDNAYEHQGDWEHVTVYVDGTSLHSVDYHGHGCEPINVTASEFNKFDSTNPTWPATSDTHPVVLASAGSHASWPWIPDDFYRGGWPTNCPGGVLTGEDIAIGATDSFKFGGTTKIWKVGESLKYAPEQPWYDFGGRWGDTDGPLGLPYAVAQEVLPHTTDLSQPYPGKIGWIEPPKKLTFMPLEPGSMKFVNGLPGLKYKAVLQSLPTVIGSGTFGSDGTAEVAFTIPGSTPPGSHVLSVYDASSGDLIGAVTIVVGVTPECNGAATGMDSDSDGLSDACDDRVGDGPNDDFDNDGVVNSVDNCPTISNGDQEAQGFSVGVACNPNLGNSPLASYPEIPIVAIEATVNGEQSAQVEAGQAVEWVYRVVNIGEVDLSDVLVKDDLHGEIDCPNSGLSPGDSMICTVTNVAQIGTQGTKVTVAATRPNFDYPALAESEAEYVGVSDVDAVTIDTTTQGTDSANGDSITGDGIRVVAGTEVLWTYTVTNNTERTLVDVVVTDSMVGAVSCPASTLDAGASLECAASGVAKATGSNPYSNVGSVSAVLDGQTVTASDPSGYVGVPEQVTPVPKAPAIHLDKVTNGHDGMTFEVGTQITWTYTVTNIGDLAVADIAVNDDREGPIVCPGSSLNVGESMQCELQGIVVEGPYLNVATVTGSAADGTLVKAVDASNYFGKVEESGSTPTAAPPTPVSKSISIVAPPTGPSAPVALVDAPKDPQPDSALVDVPKPGGDEGLAFTGRSTRLILTSGAVVLLLGVALRVVGRRRRTLN